MSSKPYNPSAKILDNYAQVLVNFALNSGEGVKPDEIVECFVPDVAKPLALALQNTILKAGAHPMVKILPTGFDRDFYTLANQSQLTFFPKKFFREKVDLIDHQIMIIADVDPEELSQVDPGKIILARDSKKEYRDWRTQKEAEKRFTWTLGLWGVEAKAKMVGLSYQEYWQQIINACFLDKADPIAEWKRVVKLQESIKNKLNDLKIVQVRVQGEDVDLTVKIGADRVWKGGSGRNIPSFELFTSPDWRGTEGWIKFNQPLYRYGQIIRDIYLKFERGLVVEAKAGQGNDFLQQMLKSPNADKLGEFSLTDQRMSRITHVMAETLFDENIGGPQGNTHVAIGMAYKDCFRGDAGKVSTKQWEAMGFNDSAEHTDMISTTQRTVTAVTSDGSELTIYQDGKFVI
jgi:aminopeptidase